METASRLIAAMAERCRDLILNTTLADDPSELPIALRPHHLLWMCDQIVNHAEVGPDTKLHRWIGFVQGGMLANRILDLAGVKAMFDEVKRAHGSADDDLLDHLDFESSFQLEIGGES